MDSWPYHVCSTCTLVFFRTFQHNHRLFFVCTVVFSNVLLTSLILFNSTTWCRRISPCPRISPCSRISPPKCPCETDKPMGLSAGFYGTFHMNQPVEDVSYLAVTVSCGCVIEVNIINRMLSFFLHIHHQPYAQFLSAHTSSTVCTVSFCTYLIPELAIFFAM